MTDYVIRREDDGVSLVVNGMAFRSDSVQVYRGFGEPTRITIRGHTIKLKIGDTLRYEGYEPEPEPAGAGPTRLQYMLCGEILASDDLRRLAFDLYRLEHGGCWTGDVPTAHRVNIAVDWWNGDAKEMNGG